MSLSRRYGIINVAYHGSFHDGKELYTMSNVKRKDSKNRNLRNGESVVVKHFCNTLFEKFTRHI